LSYTCAASSLVGVSISAFIFCFLCVGFLCNKSSKSGSVKPAVLPVPVCAPARISFFCSMTGIAFAWIGVG